MAEAPDECAQCGEAIPRRALACPACGADERTGWDSDGDEETDIPDYLTEDFDPATDGGENIPGYEGQGSRRASIIAALAFLIACGWVFLAVRGWH